MALLTPSAWQKRLSLCQSPGPARKWLSVAMGQQLPGRHLGQLKPWECLSNRISGHFCCCIAQFLLRIHCYSGLLMARRNLFWWIDWDHLRDPQSLCIVVVVFRLHHLLFIWFTRPRSCYWTAQTMIAISQMTRIDKARNFMLNLPPRLNYRPTLCQNCDGKKRKNKKERVGEAERN